MEIEFFSKWVGGGGVFFKIGKVVIDCILLSSTVNDGTGKFMTGR
jgi:hypothetical protein